MSETYEYPILKEITEYYSSQKSGDFNDVYICACQHLLEPQKKMFELMVEFGIPKENICILGKIYSTSFEVLKELQDQNFNITQPDLVKDKSFDDQHRENCKKLFQEFISKVPNGSKIILLDDGGELLKIANEHWDAIKEKGICVGIEQTSSGFRKLENDVLNFPVVNVARSSIKLVKESPLISLLGCNRIVDVFAQYAIKEPRILVVGLGPVGKSVLEIFKSKGYFVLGHDVIFDSKSELINLVADNNINMIVGATGTNIITPEQLEAIKNKIVGKIYLVSISSADREFPAVYIRTHGVAPSAVHGDVVFDDILMINNGFPITFKGCRYESTPAEIEMTIALLYGSTLDSCINTSGVNGFVEVSDTVTNIIEKYE